MKNFNTYYSRLSYLLRLGQAVCDTALYHPSSDFWANSEICSAAIKTYDNEGVSLEEKNVYFDIIDDFGIESAQITPEGLKLGNAVYKHIIVPECKFMPESIKEKIAPYISDGKPLLKTKNPFLHVMARKTENGVLYFVFNQGEKTAEEILDIKASNLYKINVQCGEIYKAEQAKISLACGEIAVFFATDEVFPCDSEKEEYSIEITGLIPVSAKRFIIDRFGIDMKSIKINEIPEKDFSGEITYAADYKLPEAPKTHEKYRIILENTSVSASVVIGGKKVADFGMTPMTAVIDGKALAQCGNIEITVANTAADEIVAKSDIIESYPIAEITPYHEISVQFEKRRPKLCLGTVRIEKVK